MGKDSKIKIENSFNGIYKNKKVFVTGHTGFKGAWLCLWLTALGAKVAGFAKGLPTDPSLFNALGLKSKIAHYEGDITQFFDLEKAVKDFKPDIIFHLAAQPIVRLSYDEPKKTFDINAGGTVNVLEALRTISGIGAGVIITTDKVYENVGQAEGYVEGDRLGGEDPYSASKACAEIATHSYYCSFFKKSGPKVASARAGNVIGGGDWAADRIIPDCVKASLKKEEVIVRKPQAVRPWQHVMEPLSGYLWLGACLLNSDYNVNGEAFNFGPRPEAMATVGELTDKFFGYLGSGSWRHVPLEGDKKEANLLTLDCQKAMDVISWKPILSFEQTTQLTASWYKEYYKDTKDIQAFTLNQIQDYIQQASQNNMSWACGLQISV